ncbi:MAG: valine--tRNA ligase, partial [Alicyclobacillus sp.]|nr:valine--tRNA ligase [Alicyclobacillus sp.]
YQSLIGQKLRLPLTDKEIPIIADAYVDPEYGTGCVKITPAHDPNDFEVGERHGLKMPQCIDADGRLNELAGAYQGMEREEARKRVAADLEAQGYMVKAETMTHAVGHCSRCETVVEPYLSDQWFVRMAPLAEPALAAIERQELRFVPQRFEKVFVHWLENVRDWCISRQLWWGHRIPAWYCDDCRGITVSREDAERCAHCGSAHVHQDEDVLDTWFSSALWPFSTMGWPDLESADLKRYFPTNVLITGYDIIFFWVARMVFMGLKFTGRMHFRDVVLHGLIRADDGRKMSKSLGNGVDPIDVIEKYGADALRFMLANGTSPGNDQRFSWERVEGARNFVNKIWNAARFVLMNLPDDYQPAALDRGALGVADRWILHRLAETIETVDDHLSRYDFGEAGRALYDFAWDDFCDWYIEFSKLALYGDDAAQQATARAVLVHVLNHLLRLLHPFIPFVTEEIWQSLPGASDALVAAPWPTVSPEDKDEAAAKQIAIVMDAVRAVRNIRSERNVPPSKSIAMLIRPSDSATAALLEEARPYFLRFCNLHALDLDVAATAPDLAVTAVVTGAELYLPLADLVDLAEERARLEKERERLRGEVDRVTKKLANAQFVERAPAAVVAAEREKEADYRAKLAAVEARLRALGGV